MTEEEIGQENIAICPVCGCKVLVESAGEEREQQDERPMGLLRPRGLSKGERICGWIIFILLCLSAFGMAGGFAAILRAIF